MAYVRQAKADRRKIITTVVIGLGLIFVSIISGLFISNGLLKKNQYEKLPSNINLSKQVNLLRASQRIQAGEAVDITKFEMVAVPKELVPEGVITSTQLLKGKRVTDNLEKGEFILQKDLIDSAAWYEEGDRLMEHTFQDGVIPATVDVGSLVDIKLFKQGAEDSIVISKIAVVGKNQNTLSFYLNSAEQEYLKEANTEGQLFLVQYLDKSQPTSGITYYPSYNKGQAVGKANENDLRGGN